MLFVELGYYRFATPVTPCTCSLGPHTVAEWLRIGVSIGVPVKMLQVPGKSSPHM